MQNLRRCAMLSVLAAGVTLTGVACGSSAPSKAAPPVSKQAGLFGMKTDLKVVNRSGRDLTMDICHDGYCNGVRTLQHSESQDAAGSDISGWVKLAWGVGNGPRQNQYTGVMGNAAGPYMIDFKAFNPDVGQPWIEASLPNGCQWKMVYSNGRYYSQADHPARWVLDVNQQLQSRTDSLCSYSMVGSRAPDGEYKMLILEVYAPDQGNSCWEPTPGPVKLPESPDGSWSCWPEGPKPAASVGYTSPAPA
jgi:hypothetical protein